MGCGCSSGEECPDRQKHQGRKEGREAVGRRIRGPSTVRREPQVRLRRDCRCWSGSRYTGQFVRDVNLNWLKINILDCFMVIVLGNYNARSCGVRCEDSSALPPNVTKAIFSLPCDLQWIWEPLRLWPSMHIATQSCGWLCISNTASLITKACAHQLLCALARVSLFHSGLLAKNQAWPCLIARGKKRGRIQLSLP